MPRPFLLALSILKGFNPMPPRFVKKWRFAVMTAVACFMCVTGSVVATVGVALRCELLKNIPEAPVYPGATLVNETSQVTLYSIANKRYTTPDAPDKVAHFYQKELLHLGDQANTACLNINLGGACFGHATPFGQYSVYIDHDAFLKTGATTFSIEFRWKTCGWDFY